MNESKAVAVYHRPQLTPDVWHMITEVAPTMHLARWFGVANTEQAAAIMLKGYELGLGLAASFEFIKPVQNKPALVPMGALALIHSSPLIEKVVITDMRDDKGVPTGCQVSMKRVNGFEYACSFTIDDAIRAGLIKPDSGWEKYPANMCRWRAIGFCADVVCPDILGGLKRADELGADLTPEGDVIEGSWKPVTQETSTPPAQAAPTVEPAATPTLTDLVAKYGAEAIMAANEGRIPGTDAEVLAVAGKLTVANG